MTDDQAKKRLVRLLEKQCTCDCDEDDETSITFACHFAGCPYRTAVLIQLPQLRPYAGSLYPARQAA